MIKSFCDFDFNGTRTYQPAWSEVTDIGAAWKNMKDLSSSRLDCLGISSSGTKSRALCDPELQPPRRRRRRSLLHKLDALVAAPPNAALQVVKGKALLDIAVNGSDSDLTDYEDAQMNI